MTKIISLLLVVFLYNHVFTQIVPLSPYSIQSSIREKKVSQVIDTLSLPFIEDFSTYNGNPDTLRFYNEGGVLINNNYPLGNRSRNVATFDGLDQFGIPYEQIPTGGNPNTISNGEGDYLISKPINLQGLTKKDSVVLSFWWQKGGVHNVLAPDLEESDSINLFFLDRDSLWIKVWPLGESKTNIISAIAGSAFQADSININKEEYLHSGFQFMFISEGTLTGNFDIWNINHLMIDVNLNDQYIDDYSFGPSLTSLLKNYRAMPYEQFIVNIEEELSDEVSTTFYNSDNINRIIEDSLIVLRDTVSGIEIEKIKTNFNPNLPGAIIINSLGSFNAAYTPDKTKIAASIETINPSDNFMVLETSISAYIPDLISDNNAQTSISVLDNYYAYDDGTAEVGFGIIGTGGLACKFELNKASTLHSLDLHFVRSGVDNDNSTINLKVWKSITGVDGATVTEVLITTRVSIIMNEYGINKFYNYEFSTPIELESGTFYVGWEQVNIAARYVIGFDLSQNNIDKIYTFKDNSWGQNFTDITEGTAMIRPYFGEKRVTSIPTLSKDINVELYPNPTNNSLYIYSNENVIKSLNVFDLNGKLVLKDMRATNNQVTFDLPNGVYIVLISTQKGILREKFVVIR
jgi:hypothetical protein